MATNYGSPDAVICDVLIVGGGFGGMSALYRLRKLGYNVKLFEAGNDFGGVWYWNRYPGARVDSEFPFYQLNIPEVYDHWNFTERFPAQKEIKGYADHLDNTLNLRKDATFNARVNSAQWDSAAGRWSVRTSAGHAASCKYLFLATGLLHRQYVPDFPGLGMYNGRIHHSAFWPENEDLTGKRVAVIGAGATGVQIVQELAKQAAHLTLFMRRPSFCLPMQNRCISLEEQNSWRAYYPRLFENGRNSRSGFPGAQQSKSMFDVSEDERESLFEKLWQRGAFNFFMNNYSDSLADLKANKIMYDFWRRKVQSRITDPVKKELMAPEELPYPMGTKRLPLEGDYYECLDQKNVEIVNLKATTLKTFTEKGILMEDERNLEFDAIVMATGFDSFSGSLTNMGLQNKDGVDIKDIWAEGIESYLGMLIHGFPNLFMVYSPQAPTAFSNGPTILECQIDIVSDIIQKLESEKAHSIEATRASELEWTQLIEQMSSHTLLPMTDSWWNGGNIPGKRRQMLTFPGGIDMYEEMCREKLEGWQGFDVVMA